MDSQDNKQLVYIIGTGRSGSTLLDMMIGAHSQVFSCGEIMDFKRHYNDNTLCGCNLPINECSLWAKVIQSINFDIYAEKTRLNFNNKFIRLSTFLLNYLFNIISGNNRNILKDNLLTANCKRIVKTIIHLTGKNILIDSSKSPIRALYLYNENIVKNQKCIYITRDARGFMHSRVYRSEDSVTPVFAAKKWLLQNILCLFVFNRFDKMDRLHIKYEDLAESPNKILKNICILLGLPYEESMVEFRSKEHHNIGGNAMKNESGGIYKPVKTWRNEFGNREYMAYNLYARRMNKHFGYEK